MRDAKIVELIRTELEERGGGDEPYRIITQYWAKDGTLIWEHDPHLTSIKLKSDNTHAFLITIEGCDDEEELENIRDGIDSALESDKEAGTIKSYNTELITT